MDNTIISRRITPEKIAIDLDGVIWDSHSILLKIYNEIYNESVSLADITYWDYLPKERFWVAYKKTCQLIDTFKPNTSFIPNYLLLLNSFYKLDFLTHGLYTKKQIKNKLKTWGIYKKTHYHSIIIEHYTVSKTTHNYDYFIDDNPNMWTEIQKYPKKHLLLYRQPWNAYLSSYSNIMIVANWQEITKVLILKKFNDLVDRYNETKM